MSEHSVAIYDDFGQYYDLLNNWQDRLASELPFLLDKLSSIKAHRVLDSPGGTAMHSIALARQGYEPTCAEPSETMLRQAAANIARAGLKIATVQARFDQLRERLQGDFDALFCMGDSLTHVLTAEALQAALANFAAVLRPGGIAIIQNPNFATGLPQRNRFMPLVAAQTAEGEILCLRFLDFGHDLLSFTAVLLIKEKDKWHYEVRSVPVHPITAEEIETGLQTAGFRDWRMYGDYRSSPFDPDRSGNLVVVATR